MALIVDPQSSFKHFCKICKKGFGCGTALGGHMRAHGIGDEASHMDEDDQASDWEDKLVGGGGPPTNKRMYALRTNPNRLKSVRVCENCGKEFLSWKSFLEHGKCSSEDAESLVSSPGSDGEDAAAMRGCGWSKRKRSLRAKVGNFISNCPSSEEEDLANCANCLMMLSNATVDPLMAEPEESCASASKDEDRIRNPINLLASPKANYNRAPPAEKAKGVAGKGLFECKACKKVFNSHQALGGHRASHKKVKGCFAARLDQGMDESLGADEDATTHDELTPNNKATSNFQFDHGSLNYTHPKKKSKVHECSICHRVFSTGQALGGHKRCHWITSNAPDPSTSMAMATKLHQFQDHLEQIQQRPKFVANVVNVPASDPLLDLTLDLNLPAPADRDAQANNKPSSFDMSTEIFLQPWTQGADGKAKGGNHHEADQEGNTNNHKINNNNKNSTSPTTPIHNVEDEAESMVKLAKLSELKELNMTGGSSPWLQVGIGSTTDVGAEP